MSVTASVALVALNAVMSKVPLNATVPAVVPVARENANATGGLASPMTIAFAWPAPNAENANAKTAPANFFKYEFFMYLSIVMNLYMHFPYQNKIPQQNQLLILF
ncbi:MAG: hypothetical protein V4488_13795 [Pseudomonadota bacterium]